MSEIPSETLNDPIRRNDIRQISRHHFKWEPLLEMLGLSIEREREIKARFRDYGEQKFEALQRWKEIRGDEATYRALIMAAVTMDEISLAVEVADMLRQRQTPDTSKSGMSKSRNVCST